MSTKGMEVLMKIDRQELGGDKESPEILDLTSKFNRFFQKLLVILFVKTVVAGPLEQWNTYSIADQLGRDGMGSFWMLTTNEEGLTGAGHAYHCDVQATSINRAAFGICNLCLCMFRTCI